MDRKWILFWSVKTQLLFIIVWTKFTVWDENAFFFICGHSEEWQRQREEIFICINYTFVFSCKRMAIYCKSEYYCISIIMYTYLKCCSYLWSDCFAWKGFRKGIIAWLWNVFMQINYCIKDGIYHYCLWYASFVFNYRFVFISDEILKLSICTHFIGKMLAKLTWKLLLIHCPLQKWTL